MAEDLALESLDVGAQPLLEPFLKGLRLREFFEQALGRPDRRLAIPHAEAALLLVRNIALCRHPLYELPAWVRRFDPALLGLEPQQLEAVNDDRLGRTLDRLFRADRRSLMTRVAVHMVEAFGLDLGRLHNDSTTITFSGEYRPQAPRSDGRRRLRIVHGKNKDHRPDLKQLVWTLTISRDGAVPVHYNVDDGNVTDDRTHLRTWQVLREIAGRADFIYVADCKLCTRESLAFIAGQGGHFVTVLPQTRKEDATFKQWILEHHVPWEEIWRRPPLRRRTDPPDVFEAVEAPLPSTEGYRIVWYRSSEKCRRDEQARTSAIRMARFRLERLRERVGHRRLKTRTQVQAAVDKILEATKASPWMRVELAGREQDTYKQARRGRPGPKTRYVRRRRTVYEPIVILDEQRIKTSAAADGIFPLLTDLPLDQVSSLDLLKIYKYQAFLEKRHEQLKTAADVVPVNFKSPERIEAFLFLYFVAVMIHALLERQVRSVMKDRGLPALPIYPEERACRAPTADKILELFEPLRLHRLRRGERVVHTFWDKLSDPQRVVLDLLGVPIALYGH